MVRYRYPPHKEFRVPASYLPPPETAGFRPSIGEKPGKHYRLPLDDGTGIHVRLYEGWYYIHWDRCDPISRGVLCHLLNDAPHWIPALAGLAGMAYGKLRNPSANLNNLLEEGIKWMIIGTLLTAIFAPSR
jgi:hypothetical protein